MKLKILFLKRKHIYYFILVTVVFIFFIISLLIDNNAVNPIFNIKSNYKSYKIDLTGDGKEDTLYITINKNKYNIQVNTDKDSIYLEPSKNLYTLGSCSEHWPIRMNILDISRDKIPEIFIQSCQNNKPIQHIFIYKNNQFKDIFCSYNNVLGIIDNTNNKTPKLISGSISQNGFLFSNYILIQNKLEKYNYNHPNTFMGKDTILHLINFVTSYKSEETKIPVELFHSKISSNSLSTISNLNKSDNNYIFQDAFFIDKSSDKDGYPTEIQWILNFREISPKNIIKNYTLKLNLRAFKNSKDKYYFKIYYVSDN